MNTCFSLTDVTLGYGSHAVIEDLTVAIPQGSITTLIGPNGCGKSTLLAGLCHLLRPTAGTISYQGKSVAEWAPRERARTMALLPQSPVAPPGLTVTQLVARGRHPHQSWLQQWSQEDEQQVAAALAQVGAEDLAHAEVANLSGGQRQRVWIAMVLAQHTPTLLLDEPTTYLDLAHALDVLQLVHTLQRDTASTVVMVLHDLMLAARFSDYVIAFNRHGQLAAHGKPADVLTPQLLEQAFGLRADVIPDPRYGRPLVIPH